MVTQRTFPLAVLVIVALPASGLAQEEIGISRGSMPEAASVVDLDGNAVDLADFVGRRPVILEFWATWCEQCEALMPQFASAYEAYSDQMEFLAVAVGVGQSPRSIQRHLRRHPMPYPVLFDRRGAAVRAYSVPTTSYVVILDAEGRVAYTGVGRDQDIGEAIRGVLGET